MRSWNDYKSTMPSESVLFEYARQGDLEAIQAINPHLDDLNAKDSKGYSTLMLAAYNGHLSLTRYLLAQGVEVNSSDNAGNSILMGAAFKGYLEIVKALVDAGADISMRSPKNLNAEQFADMFGRSEIANFLQQQRQ